MSKHRCTSVTQAAVKKRLGKEGKDGMQAGPTRKGNRASRKNERAARQARKKVTLMQRIVAHRRTTKGAGGV